MNNERLPLVDIAPESSAARVALWRALHTEIEQAPHVIEDTVGLKLLNPEEGWRNRGDMNPEFTKMFRASIVARARFIDDLVIDLYGKGVNQYIILGAGLDSFAQRKKDVTKKLQIFEVDKPGPQKWKEQRLVETAFGVSSDLHFVPVDFEAGESWLLKCEASGLDKNKPVIIASTGVSMYLTREANVATLKQIASLAKGSVLAMSFLIPADQMQAQEKKGLDASAKGAKSSGTPFISFFSHEDIIKLALEAGFSEARCISGEDLNQQYFKNRSDGFYTGHAESILVATK